MPMTRGFPRPRKFIEKIVVKDGNSRMNYDRWNKRSYPIPYSAKLNAVGDIAKGRVGECNRDRLCMVCGILVEDAKPWAYYLWYRFERDSGPFHEKCVTLTKTMCPVVAENPNFKFVQVDWESLEARDFAMYEQKLKDEITRPI
jgi:hypothetical protein